MSTYLATLKVASIRSCSIANEVSSMSARLTQAELSAGWWNVNCCDGKFRGSMTAHCTACCETFSRPTVAERHRRYGRCLDPASLRDRSGVLVFKDAGRAYPCWVGAGDEVGSWVEGVRG